MPVAESIDALRVLRVQVATEAPLLAAERMAEAANLGIRAALSRRSHAEFEPTNSPRGEPPARISGKLIESFEVVPAVPLRVGVAFAIVGSRLVYAAIHETGGVITAKRAPYLRWRMTDGLHAAQSVTIPQRPYVAPTVAVLATSGALASAGASGFVTGLSA